MKRIEFIELSKEYGNTKALDSITLTLETNKIYGLLGRNGAGKTTLLNLITNRIFPTSGTITIDGDTVFENDKVLKNIFYMAEKNLYRDGDKIKNIFSWTKEFYPLFDIKYAKVLSEKFELNINKKVKDLSTGYTTIFKAILALASNAEIIILDEPVLGLDAYHRDLFYKELIANYNESLKTIIISTHLIEEVAQVIEDVIIIKEGKLIMKQSVEDLLSNSYTVSGDALRVNQYIKDKKYIGKESIGKFMSAIVVEDIQNKNKSMANDFGIELSNVELQKLFISLTN